MPGVHGLEGFRSWLWKNELHMGFFTFFLPPSLLPILSASASPYNRCKGSIYLVFDFCEHDLAGLLSNVLVKFTLSEIKKVMQMLLNGLYYIHRNKVGEERPRLGLTFAPTAGWVWLKDLWEPDSPLALPADPAQGHEGSERAHHPRRGPETGRLWAGQGLQSGQEQPAQPLYQPCGDALVPAPGAIAR